MRRARLLRASYFISVIVPVGLYLLFQTAGLPHVIWSYDWRPLGPGSHRDSSRRYYIRCTYVGTTGALTEYPTDGTCGYVRFARPLRAAP
ncbi:hypothetical protein [Xanthobacter autotrophicus]|uniref:hypothetical protein n=1 Tax=Xanthobacter autotrophicus TaxID=280 RepID=UPI003729FE84